MSSAECYERMLAGDDFDYPVTKSTNQRPDQNQVNNKTCNTCMKSDVCMYKEEVNKVKEGIDDVINDISTNIFDVTITCKKWCINTNIRKPLNVDRNGGIL